MLGAPAYAADVPTIDPQLLDSLESSMNVRTQRTSPTPQSLGLPAGTALAAPGEYMLNVDEAGNYEVTGFVSEYLGVEGTRYVLTEEQIDNDRITTRKIDAYEPGQNGVIYSLRPQTDRIVYFDRKGYQFLETSLSKTEGVTLKVGERSYDYVTGVYIQKTQQDSDMTIFIDLVNRTDEFAIIRQSTYRNQEQVEDKKGNILLPDTFTTLEELIRAANQTAYFTEREIMNANGDRQVEINTNGRDHEVWELNYIIRDETDIAITNILDAENGSLWEGVLGNLMVQQFMQDRQPPILSSDIMNPSSTVGFDGVVSTDYRFPNDPLERKQFTVRRNDAGQIIEIILALQFNNQTGEVERSVSMTPDYQVSSIFKTLGRDNVKAKYAFKRDAILAYMQSFNKRFPQEPYTGIRGFWEMMLTLGISPETVLEVVEETPFSIVDGKFTTIPKPTVRHFLIPNDPRGRSIAIRYPTGNLGIKLWQFEGAKDLVVNYSNGSEVTIPEIQAGIMPGNIVLNRYNEVEEVQIYRSSAMADRQPFDLDIVEGFQEVGPTFARIYRDDQGRIQYSYAVHGKVITVQANEYLVLDSDFKTVMIDTVGGRPLARGYDKNIVRVAQGFLGLPNINSGLEFVFFDLTAPYQKAYKAYTYTAQKAWELSGIFYDVNTIVSSENDIPQVTEFQVLKEKDLLTGAILPSTYMYVNGEYVQRSAIGQFNELGRTFEEQFAMKANSVWDSDFRIEANADQSGIDVIFNEQMGKKSFIERVRINLSFAIEQIQEFIALFIISMIVLPLFGMFLFAGFGVWESRRRSVATPDAPKRARQETYTEDDIIRAVSRFAPDLETASMVITNTYARFNGSPYTFEEIFAKRFEEFYSWLDRQGLGEYRPEVTLENYVLFELFFARGTHIRSVVPWVRYAYFVKLVNNSDLNESQYYDAYAQAIDQVYSSVAQFYRLDNLADVPKEYRLLWEDIEDLFQEPVFVNNFLQGLWTKVDRRRLGKRKAVETADFDTTLNQLRKDAKRLNELTQIPSTYRKDKTFQEHAKKIRSYKTYDDISGHLGSVKLNTTIGAIIGFGLAGVIYFIGWTDHLLGSTALLVATTTILGMISGFVGLRGFVQYMRNNKVFLIMILWTAAILLGIAWPNSIFTIALWPLSFALGAFMAWKAGLSVRNYIVKRAALETKAEKRLFTKRFLSQFAVGSLMLFGTFGLKFLWNFWVFAWLQVPTMNILGFDWSVLEKATILGILWAPFALFYILDTFTFFYLLHWIVGTVKGWALGLGWIVSSRRLNKRLPALRTAMGEDAFVTVIQHLHQTHYISVEERDALIQGKKLPNVHLSTQEARQRLQFLATSFLRMNMPALPAWSDLPRLTINITAANEQVLYELDDRIPANDLNAEEPGSGRTKLTHMISRHKREYEILMDDLEVRYGDRIGDRIDKWRNLNGTKKFKYRNLTQLTEEEKDNIKYLVERFVNTRFHPLYRTVLGAINAWEAYRVIARQYFPEATEEQIEELVAEKLELLWSYQNYGNYLDSENEEHRNIIRQIQELLREYPQLKVSYLTGGDNGVSGLLYQGQVFQTPARDGIHAAYKPLNQNNMMNFSTGDINLFLDANNDIRIEDALKFPRMLAEFNQDSQLMVVNIPEYIITERYNYVGEAHGFGDRTWTSSTMRVNAMTGSLGFYGHGAFL